MNTLDDVCWRCEGSRCDTHAEECGKTSRVAFYGACTPCRACAPKPPGAFDSFVAGVVADCVRGEE